jgi:hypothetical protein
MRSRLVGRGHAAGGAADAGDDRGDAESLGDVRVPAIASDKEVTVALRVRIQPTLGLLQPKVLGGVVTSVAEHTRAASVLRPACSADSFPVRTGRASRR